MGSLCRYLVQPSIAARLFDLRDFLLGAVSNGISQLFAVRLVIRNKFERFLCVLQRKIFLPSGQVSIREAVVCVGELG